MAITHLRKLVYASRRTAGLPSKGNMLIRRKKKKEKKKKGWKHLCPSLLLSATRLTCLSALQFKLASVYIQVGPVHPAAALR